MTALRAGFDIDGVLANFRQAFEREADRHLADLPDPDRVDASRFSHQDMKRIWTRIQHTHNWWLSVQPFEPAQIARLYQLSRERPWEVVFMTKRPATVGDPIQFQTQRWLEDHGFHHPAVVTVPGQMVLGLGAAMLLNAQIRGRAFFRGLFYLPVVTSWLVVSYLFAYLFSDGMGPVNFVLVEVLRLLPEPIDWLRSTWTAQVPINLLGIWKGVGWNMVIFLAALQYIPSELYEAAETDGATNWQRFRYVTLPLLLPYVLTLVSNLVLLFTRPANLSLVSVIVAFVLNLAVSVVTVVLATPIYTRIKQSGQASPEEMEQLLRINLLRLVLSTLSSLVVIYMLITLLSA